MLAGALLVLACIALEVLIVFCLASLATSHVSTLYIYTCKSLRKEFRGVAFHPKFWNNKENELVATSFKVRFSPTLHQDGFGNLGYKRRGRFF
jgi:hypothetical protein